MHNNEQQIETDTVVAIVAQQETELPSVEAQPSKQDEDNSAIPIVPAKKESEPQTEPEPAAKKLGEHNAPHLPLYKLFWIFLKFGCRAFGGPVAQIAMVKQQLVDEEKWITNEQFNRILAVYQVLPGPEATELCCYFGMLSRGRIGSILAGLGFVLPGFFLMFLSAILYVNFGLQSPIVRACFAAIQPATCAMMFRAIHKIGDHAFQDSETHKFEPWMLFIGIVSTIQGVMNIPFFITLIVSGIVSIILHKTKSLPFVQRSIALVISIAILLLTMVSYVLFDYFVIKNLNTKQTASTLGQVLAFVSAPTFYNIFLLGLLGGLLTFGGAYTAIPFVQQFAVEMGGWLTNQQFLDGIAIGSILPCPLVIFTTFVGFLGGGIVGSLLMTLGMFIPAFSFTLIGHNLFERAVANKAFSAFLDGITASVVGLVVVSGVEMLRAVKDVYGGIIFMIALYALYQFKYKLTSVVIVILAGCAGVVLYGNK